MNNKTTSKEAIREIKGISKQKSTNKDAISKLKRKRQKQPSVEELLAGILESNTTALSRGITLIESQKISHQIKAKNLIENLIWLYIWLYYFDFCACLSS